MTNKTVENDTPNAIWDGSAPSEMLESVPGGHHCCADAPEKGYPFVYLSGGFLNILGWTQEEIQEKFHNQYTALIHPDDVQFGLQCPREGQGQTGHRKGSNIFRMLGKDGYHWVTETVNELVIEGKRYMQGSVSDISCFMAQKGQHTAEDVQRTYVYEQEMRDVRNLMRAARWILILDDEKKIERIWFSDEFRHVIGYENETDFPNAMEMWTSRIHPEDYESAMENFAAAIQDRTDHTPFDFQYRIQKKTGEYIWVRSAAKFRRDGKGKAHACVGIFVDVNDAVLRREMERKLLEINEAQKVQLDEIKVLNAELVDRNRVFQSLGEIYASMYYIDITGNHFTELTSVTDVRSHIGFDGDAQERLNYFCHHMILPEYTEEMRSFVDLTTLAQRLGDTKILSKEYRSTIFKNPEEQGTWRMACFIEAARDKAGHLTHVIFSTQSIHAEKIRELENQRALADALAAAEHANRAKTSFLNNMSHDIRTPMNAIVGFTALAAKHAEDPDKVREYLTKIATSSSHLLSLINDVLDMSRIESGKVKIDESEVHLPDVLHDLRTIIQSDVAAKNMELFVDTLDVKDEDVICDKLRLNQILLNLLSNAIKYTNSGGTVSLRVIQKPCANTNYTAFEFRVKDNGIGMSPEFLQHIFQPFERMQSSTVSGIQGTGLGLSITKNIVKMMGGEITVTSEEGKGSEFVVALQFKKGKMKTSYEKIQELQGVRILVADDSMETCFSVCKMLMEIGMRPDWTTTGKEAVARAKFALEQNDEYGAYIIDWLMPDMNGIETVRRIRRMIGDSKPIIILTAYDWAPIEAEAREAGVTSFCSKPLFMSELREALTSSKQAKPEKPAEESVPDFTGRKVLLVEDNLLNQEIATEILKQVGFAVDTVNDGDIAVEKLRHASEGQYDLVLMDIQMPKLDGYMATREIRTLDNPFVSNIPIIAMTANAFEEDKKKAFEAGMNGHIAKPIDVDKLMYLLKGILYKDC